MLPEGIELALQERRSMEQALVDLQATYAETPSPRLSRMISLLEAEIALRARNRSRVPAAST
jgi:hypothetical protein